MVALATSVRIMNLFNIFKPKVITQEEIDADVKNIKAEMKYKRMYITPPPLQRWVVPEVDEKGYIKGMKMESNQDEIDRWKREHYDWLEDVNL